MAVLKYKDINGNYVPINTYNISSVKPIQTTGTSIIEVMSQDAVTRELNTKVTKENGKSLISITEIQRLSTITNYDDTNINNELLKKATIINLNDYGITFNNSSTITAKQYTDLSKLINDKQSIFILPINNMIDILNNYSMNGYQISSSNEVTADNSTIKFVFSNFTLYINKSNKQVVQNNINPLFDIGVNKVNTMENLPTDKRNILAEISSASNISFNNSGFYTLYNGIDFYIKIINISNTDIILPIPNVGVWKNVNNITSITLSPSNTVEMSIWRCDDTIGNEKYTIRMSEIY